MVATINSKRGILILAQTQAFFDKGFITRAADVGWGNTKRKLFRICPS